MATANETINTALLHQGCLGKAQDDEPVFVLRAQDALAPEIVEEWAKRAMRHQCPISKVEEALRLVGAMREWQVNNTVKFPD